MRRERGLWIGLAVAVIKPLLLLLTTREWRGGERLRTDGGLVLAVNHTTYGDPLVVAHFVWDSGRTPRFLAKSSLFALPVLGRLMRGAKQIPVHRGTSDASQAFSSAVAAVHAGECVIVYPEATITRDPQLWPMAGKTGAARIALATGAPVVPVAQWGAHELLPPYSRRPRLHRRTHVRVAAGPPVDLADLVGREPTGDDLQVATDRIMDALTALLATLRPGEQPPARRYDPGGAADGAAAAPDEGAA